MKILRQFFLLYKESETMKLAKRVHCWFNEKSVSGNDCECLYKLFVLCNTVNDKSICRYIFVAKLCTYLLTYLHNYYASYKNIPT